MTHIYVLDHAEFAPLVEDAKRQGYRVEGPLRGHWKISAKADLHFERKKAGMSAALWNTALGGGVSGEIAEFDRYQFRITGEAA